MASGNFRNLTRAFAMADVDFAVDTFKCLLVSSLSAAQLDTWTVRSNVTVEIAATGGYTAGGFAVTASVGSVDTVNDWTEVTFSASNPVYTSSTISAVGGLIYKSTGVAANDLLVAFVDFGGTVASSSGNYSVTFTTPLRIKTT
jgi:hypothetical protein